jgi:hypothetical protein
MPRDGLNPRQEAFAKRLAEGASQRAAYLAAGYDGRGKTADEAASQLSRNLKVKTRVAELQAKAAQKHEITMERLTRDLLFIRDNALRTDQNAAAVAALALIAKMHGFITDKAQIDVVHHKPARLPAKQLELTEDEWLSLYNPPHREAIVAPGRGGNGRNP